MKRPNQARAIRRQARAQRRAQSAFKRAQRQAQQNRSQLNPTILAGFQPDFGNVCHKVGKTRYEMNMQRWMQELLSSGINKIPHRPGEYTMTVGYGNPVKEYCATWGITDQQKSQIADLMRKGHCGFYIDFEIGEPTVTQYETIRILHITSITPSKETYTVGGKFMVHTLQGGTTLERLADGWENPKLVPVPA